MSCYLLSDELIDQSFVLWYLSMGETHVKKVSHSQLFWGQYEDPTGRSVKSCPVDVRKSPSLDWGLIHPSRYLEWQSSIRCLLAILCVLRLFVTEQLGLFFFSQLFSRSRWLSSLKTLSTSSCRTGRFEYPLVLVWLFWNMYSSSGSLHSNLNLPLFLSWWHIWRLHRVCYSCLFPTQQKLIFPFL